MTAFPRWFSLPAVALLAGVCLCAGAAEKETASITQHGITWHFDRAYPSGQFCNGDYWVLGPVEIVGITTDLHAPGFEPQPGENGSMVNPGVDSRQGYDNRLTSYDESLNAALPGGNPVSKSNPLRVDAGSSLVSMVSWLYRSPEDAEPGTPRFNAGTNAPRPVTRSAAVLTILDKAPPEGSFRPPYAGTDKAVKFNLSQLDRGKLQNLPPVAGTPAPDAVIASIQRPWIDHGYEFLGAMFHPSENMPNYGREIAAGINAAALLLNMDFSSLPGGRTKDELLIPFVQLGIDLAGIADAGGGWPANGGHHMGRKLPILMAGVLLGDDHMKGAGNWNTQFQEDEQTFVVSDAEVQLTSGGRWKPDDRGGPPEPYTKEDVGLAEWGIRHTRNPEANNKAWNASYRAINNSVIVGMVLAARLMDLETAWNHPPLFAYADRVVEIGGFEKGTNSPPQWVLEFWSLQSPKK
jgi:hypothetical protein